MKKINNSKCQKYLDHIRLPRCPMCGDFNWDFELHKYRLISDEDSIVVNEHNILETPIPVSTYPILTISCKVCGHMNFINSKFVDILDSEEEV